MMAQHFRSLASLALSVLAVAGAAADEEDLLARLLDHDRRVLEEFRAALPEGYTAKPDIHTTYTEKDPTNLRPYIVSIMPLAPDGKPDGEHKFYDKARNVIRVVPYRDGVRHGLETELHFAQQQSTVIGEVPWQDGRIVGVKKAYHRTNGKLRMEAPYSNGVRDGVVREYDLAGRLEREMPYRKGKREGESTDYWSVTGKPRRVVPYRKDKVHGTVREYHENGRLRRERPVRDEAFHGVEKQYNEDGELISTVYWLDDGKVTEEQYRAGGGRR